LNVWREFSTWEDQQEVGATGMKDWVHSQPQKPWLAPTANESPNDNAQAKHLRIQNYT